MNRLFYCFEMFTCLTVFAVTLICKTWTNVRTSQTEAVSSFAWIIPVDLTAPARKVMKNELMTSQDANVSHNKYLTTSICISAVLFAHCVPFQRCVILLATTMDCVLLQTAVTVLQAIQDQVAQVHLLRVCMTVCQLCLRSFLHQIWIYDFALVLGNALKYKNNSDHVYLVQIKSIAGHLSVHDCISVPQ